MKREHKTAARRQDIVLAALGCFIRHGFHQTSVRDIAQAAGVSLGNLYNHFAGKEALIAEIATLEMVELAPLLAALPALPPRQALLRFAADYHALCAQPANVALSSEVIAEAARQPALARLFAANRAQLVAALVAVIAAGVAGGDIDPALPAPAVAELLLDTVEGQAMRGALFGSAPDTTPLLALLDKLLRPTLGGQA